MGKPGVVLIAILLVLAAPTLVIAAELYTPLIAIAVGETIVCSVLNVSSKVALLVRAELRGLDGTLFAAVNSPMDPGIGGTADQAAVGSGLLRYCKFTVDGPKSSILAGATVSPGGSFIPAQ